MSRVRFPLSKIVEMQRSTDCCMLRSGTTTSLTCASYVCLAASTGMGGRWVRGCEGVYQSGIAVGSLFEDDHVSCHAYEIIDYRA